MAPCWLRLRRSGRSPARCIRCRPLRGGSLPSWKILFLLWRARRKRGERHRRLRARLEAFQLRSMQRSKPAYHAAGALVAGHALALVEAATEILTRMGFPRRRAVQTLLPLMRQMLDNFEEFGAAASWTGPVARGDYSTVAKHVKALRKYPPEFGESYAALAKLGARVLSKNPSVQLREISRILKVRRGKR